MAERTIFELTSADIPGVLQSMSNAGIVVWDVVSADDLVIRFQAAPKDGTRIREMAELRGGRLRRLKRVGLSRRFLPWMRHPVLLVGICLLMVLTVWLPTRVLFIRVEGNQTVPTNLILERAEACGIGFGSERSVVRSERIKNALLEAIPQLQWAGINTSGCVATITVRERSVQPREEETVVSEIVAVTDGIVQSTTVQRGTVLCKPGQAVRAGEVLISGMTDCGLAILVTGAEGEITAETYRSFAVKTSEQAAVRVSEGVQEQKISLIIGKNRINLYNDSGILDATCVKINSVYYLTLPGGFVLPVGIAVETVTWCDTEEMPFSDQLDVMTGYARQYLMEHITAGRILEERSEALGSLLYIHYICLEMIGQNRYEEIIREDG